ncbi:hypothetical protein [Streptomyces parvulus]|uniref:hypothetical protein n=1 Tax=Streptomyces parvulus TaxID=146923 RepID=UPI003F5409E1
MHVAPPFRIRGNSPAGRCVPTARPGPPRSAGAGAGACVAAAVGLLTAALPKLPSYDARTDEDARPRTDEDARPRTDEGEPAPKGSGIAHSAQQWTQ